MMQHYNYQQVKCENLKEENIIMCATPLLDQTVVVLVWIMKDIQVNVNGLVVITPMQGVNVKL